MLNGDKLAIPEALDPPAEGCTFGVTFCLSRCEARCLAAFSFAFFLVVASSTGNNGKPPPTNLHVKILLFVGPTSLSFSSHL